MTEWQLKTPVAFLIFNRPETASRVFQAIRNARPPKLLVIADGPRQNRIGEAEKCSAARAIIELVDWPCEVLKNYSDVNLGCKRRVSSGLNWVFETVEEAIVLEDDCLPDPSFFRYGQELLERYRNDERIMMISGDNFQPGRKKSAFSYYYSRFNHVWGWASWRRAWRFYDVEMKLWPEVKSNGWLYDILADSKSTRYWSKIFDQVYDKSIDTWDYQWAFACWIQNGLTVLPCVNLVSNIGFGSEATHTSKPSPFANMKTESIIFPLSHPPHIVRDSAADNITLKSMFGVEPFLIKAVNKIKRALYEM